VICTLLIHHPLVNSVSCYHKRVDKQSLVFSFVVHPPTLTLTIEQSPHQILSLLLLLWVSHNKCYPSILCNTSIPNLVSSNAILISCKIIIFHKGKLNIVEIDSQIYANNKITSKNLSIQTLKQSESQNPKGHTHLISHKILASDKAVTSTA